MRIEIGPPLPAVKEQLLREIDAAAELARQQFLTPGAGQAMEYDATLAEASAYVAAGEPAELGEGFPFLAAELAARAAVGQDSTPSALVAEVLSQSAAWRVAGAAIKQLRREAKLRVAAATSVAEARTAAAVQYR